MTNKLFESDRRLGNIVNYSSKKVSLSQELMVNVLNETRMEKNMIMANDPIKINYYRERVLTSLQAIDAKIPELQELLNEKDVATLNEFRSLWKDFRIVLNDILELAENNEDAKAAVLTLEKGVPFRDGAINALDGLVQKNLASMEADKHANEAAFKSSINIITVLIILGLLLSVGIIIWMIRDITRRILFMSGEAEKIASREYTNYEMTDNGKDELSLVFNSLVNVNHSFQEITENANQVASGNYNNDFAPKSSEDLLGNALKKMTISLRETTAENKKYAWLANGQNQLNEKIRGDQRTEDLAAGILTFLCSYLKADIGAFYVLDEKDNYFKLTGKYAIPADVRARFALNEGLIGQAAQQQKEIYITELSDEQVQVVSTITNTKPTSLLIAPCLSEGKTLGVIELGKLSHFSDTERTFLSACMESIGISINSAMARKRIQELLEETQTQSEELQSQQEELSQINEELEEQAQSLRQQQEELQVTNEELEEQTQNLEMKNREIEGARADIEQKTKQLEISSRYKSEFLANMSHELRTPLNSLLILSKDLADNKKQNLIPDQVESAEIIYKSGQDLLGLINEVLDLSKIEAGKMVLTVERLSLRDFANNLLRQFRHQAEHKGLSYYVTLEPGLPDAIRTDSTRLDQVMKNLLSNALKFTERGSITVTFKMRGKEQIAIDVQDTGIGIPDDKKAVIFEAFHQGDGSTSRKYGGTGLGLSISRELVKLLGGELSVTSKPDEGSTFTIVVPLQIASDETQQAERIHKKEEVVARPFSVERSGEFYNYPTIADDRDTIGDNDRLLLVIEDDLKFARILLNQAHDKGFKCLSAATGEDGLVLAERFKPQAIILDLDLPGIDGDRVLMELKANPLIRHIPVHIMSVNERTVEPIKRGAIEYLTKPVDKKQLEEAFSRMENFINRKMKTLLVIEDDENSRKAIQKLIGNGDVICLQAKTGKEAIAVFSDNHVDCIVLDLGLPDMSGFDLVHELEKIKGGKIPPVIIYTGRELSKEENSELEKYAETIIIKGVKSEERLLDETALFLHRTIDNLPEPTQKAITGLYDKESIFVNKKILVVDDDMRNVFALSKVLKERGIVIKKAENGIIALRILDEDPGIDLVLMDIMMPEMDGYEAMRQIRSQLKFRKLPIIALTAKAMKEDKQKCIDAGANDYIAKPVELERLLSLMRVWLSK